VAGVIVSAHIGDMSDERSPVMRRRERICRMRKESEEIRII
jgi:hypothetical protein